MFYSTNMLYIGRPIALFSFLLLLSCSGLTQQYVVLPSKSQPEESALLDVFSPENQPSHPEGGYLLQEPKKLSEAEKDEQTRKNSLAPILYKNRSAGNINMETKQKEALDILNLAYASGSEHHYKEGLAVIWRTDPPLIPQIIFVLSGYQGVMDFGPTIGERRVGGAFTDQFSSGDLDIQKDPKAIYFITSLYKFLEDEKEENCLQSQKCQLLINPQGDYIVFSLPKMVLLFGNNERRLLVQIAIKANDEPGCFKKFFDLLTTQFFCDKDKGGSQTLELGTDYETAVQKSGIPPDLPLTYYNNLLVQVTETTVIGWKRTDFEKKRSAVPKENPLLYVGMGSDYKPPFILDHSLIKIQKTDPHSVQVSLDPINGDGTWDWKIEDMFLKLNDKQEKSGAFYWSTSMPQIKGNYKLQKNLTKALLDILERKYISFYSERGVKIKTHKKLYGEWNDKYVPQVEGTLIVSFPTRDLYLSIEFSIDHPSGNMFLYTSRSEDDFKKYILKNQKPIFLNSKKPITLNGFSLGDKIYLRNKNIGEGTAIATYLAPSQTLLTLADYSYESEIAVIYESGRDRNITYQKGESLSKSGMTFHINPTSQKKEIQGQVFDEYEINGMFSNAYAFLESLQGLCFIEGFQLDMGIFDRLFEEELNQKITQARSEKQASYPQKDFICPYIAPQDPLFSGVKRSYFFPDHFMKLAFSNRELYSLGFYKKPTQKKEE